MWTFVYVGDRPERFKDWKGSGCARDGGAGVVNYDTIPGEIRPDLGLEVGFCFDNGIVTGDGAGVVYSDRGEIHKTYHFRNGSYRFGD